MIKGDFINSRLSKTTANTKTNERTMPVKFTLTKTYFAGLSIHLFTVSTFLLIN